MFSKNDYLFVALWIPVLMVTTLVQADIYYDQSDKAIQFAVGDIQAALQKQDRDTSCKDISQLVLNQPNLIILSVQSDTIDQKLASLNARPVNQLSKEAFAIRITTTGKEQAYWIIGGDRIGTMYGGLELAEKIRLRIPVKNTNQSPYIEKRGLKFNIPLDVRTPSYADFCSAAQSNIATMWDMEYWTQFLDQLARYRYNTVSLWNCHPFPSIIKMDDYPDIALDDVMKTTIPLRELHAQYETNSRKGVTSEILSHLETIKKISIDEKISFWREVMQYAHDRGIEFYWFTWNTFVWGTDGKYGLTTDLTNNQTKVYYRQCISKTFETYPLLAGIGITAGENMRNTNKAGKEAWLYDVYAKGMNDALQKLPKDRQIRLIHRGHQVNVPSIVKQFDGFKGMLDFSFKYAGAHVYGNTDPTYVDEDFQKLPADKRAWVELRNDDIFNFRWGDPEFVRTFIANLPGKDKLRGFLMGPDGYVWGREFTSTEPETPRQLEIVKHWYRFMLWGRLGYNMNLTDAHFQAVVQNRFPQVQSKALYNAWTAASKIYPRITEFYWFRRDLEWAVEGCLSRKGWGNKGDFHTVKDFAYGPDPEGGNGDMIKIDTYVRNCQSGKPNIGTTPVELAAEIKAYSLEALAAVETLGQVHDKTLRRTIGDIRAMALLGLYYSDKLNGATELRFFDANQKQKHRDAAVSYMRSAAEHWKQLAEIAASQYHPQYLARNNYLDWKGLIPRVLEDIAIAEGTGQLKPFGPSPRTNNLSR